jgi:hypothetical protein
MTILEITEWLESTAPAMLARDSLYGFQILVGIHLLGIILSVGTLMWLDLRLMGLVMRSSRVSDLNRSLVPWFLTGFVFMFASGIMLFTGYAGAAYGNLFFRIKMLIIVLAGANALVFHFTTGRTMPAWDNAAQPPPAVRFAGLSSLVFWTIVVLAGRMMSYTMFSSAGPSGAGF